MKGGARPHAVTGGLSSLLLVAALAAHREASAQVCATPGSDGPATLSGVINTYHAGGSTAPAGATTILIGASRVGGASTPIAAGDLLLVIQMQDAAIDSRNNTRYGDGVNGDPGSGS